ncbi:PfkB family carbohydrate kinase [Pseudomonadales bacterium]|nr:PfkB family carbohydrate kinase [Pseudomonadales bacterium]
MLTENVRAALIKVVVTKAKGAGVEVALSFSDAFVAQIFADNLRSVIGDGVDLVFCNKNEALAFTDGVQGAIIFDGQATFSVSGVPADAVDTNGAWEMFPGAFLCAVTAARELKWAAELANASAARVVGQFGPRLDAIEFDSVRQKLGI